MSSAATCSTISTISHSDTQISSLSHSTHSSTQSTPLSVISSATSSASPFIPSTSLFNTQTTCLKSSLHLLIFHKSSTPLRVLHAENIPFHLKVSDFSSKLI